MSRNLLFAGALVAMTAVAVPAAAQSVANYKFGMAPSPRSFEALNQHYTDPYEPSPRRFSSSEVTVLLRWFEAGRCVVAADREASLSYVGAARGSPAEAASLERLDPAFASCLSSSGLKAKSNKKLRRAAIADALGVKPA
jgi:hypothetical protein